MTDDIVEYDLRGQICPSCLLMALNQVNIHQQALKTRQRQLHILTDDRQATGTIPDAVSNMGYQVKVEKQQGSYRIKIFQPA
jgi:TusA-related sulfurtransferase